MNARSFRKSHLAIATACVAVAIAGGVASCSGGSGKPSSSHTTATSKTQLNQLLAAGLSAQTSGNLDVAITEYQNALRIDPNNQIALYDLGTIAQQQKRAADAKGYYNQVLAINATYEPALFNLAILTDASGDTAGAEALYRRAVAANPKDAGAHFNLGLLLKRVGKTKEGDAQIREAIRLDPAFAKRSTK